MTAEKASTLKSWLMIGLMLAFILGKGMLCFFTVGDGGQPTWDYRPVKDVPGESPYAVYGVLPYPQHVRGDKGE